MTNVLVADDDEGVRGVLELALDRYTLFFAHDGQDALDQLAKQRVDAVVLDVMMPRLDGIETLRRMRLDSRLRDLPVILLTARVGEDDHLRGFQVGADAYMTKPFDPDLLVALVEEVLARPVDQRQRIREDEKAKALLLHQLERRFR